MWAAAGFPKPVQPVLARTQSYSCGTSTSLCLSPLMWSRRLFSISFNFSERNRSFESTGEKVVSLDLGSERGVLKASVVLKRSAQCCRCSCSWSYCKFQPIGSCSPGIWSFQIKLYLPLVITHLQFSPWLILGMYIMRNFLKNRKKGNGNLPSAVFFSFMTSVTEIVLPSAVFYHLFSMSIQWQNWDKTFGLIQKK